MNSASLPVEPGQIIADKYVIESVLGAGGMGYVVAARHLQLGEQVAIKFLLPELDANPEIHGRFLREARAAVRVKSEHVVRVTDVGELQDGAPYMVMEHLQGQSLDEVLKSKGSLPVADAVDYILQACEALAEAHALGIIHRDIKPANLFVTHRADGSTCIKVLDFGISKDLQPLHAMEGLTSTQQVLGSPQYMSPEQLQKSRDVDTRTDIWALGVSLYQMLTGTFPFDGDNIASLCLDIVQGTPRPLHEHKADVPVALSRVVIKCLAKERAGRFATISDLAQALTPFAPAHASLSVDRIARVLKSDSRATVPHAQGTKPSRWPLAVGAVAVAMALSAWLIWRRPESSTGPATTSAARKANSSLRAAPADVTAPHNALAPASKPKPPPTPKRPASKRNPLDVDLM